LKARGTADYENHTVHTISKYTSDFTTS